MARRRKPTGPSLLIPMIIMIFAWIGMTGLAYYLYSEIWDKQKGIVLELKKKKVELKKYEVAQSANEFELKKLSNLVGFKGDADYSDFQALSFLAQSKKREKFKIYHADYQNPTNWPSPDGDYPFDMTNNLREIEKSPYSDYVGSTSVDLKIKDIIYAQDNFINEMIEHNKSLYSAIVGLIRDRNASYLAELASTMEAYRNRDEDYVNANNEIANVLGEDDDAEDQLDESMSDLNRTFDVLYKERINLYEKSKAIRDKIKEQEMLEKAADKMHSEVKRFFPEIKELITEKNEYKGTIYYVDQDNRWAYLNLGYSDKIMKNMTFNIIRYLDSGNQQQIGILKVKKILGPRTSWCDITTIIDEEIFPKAGDKVSNSAFTLRRIKSFGFIGKFGGEYTTFSRAQMITMLESKGFQVHDDINFSTEVIILGADYQNDKYFKYIFDEDMGNELYELRDTIIFMRPDEVEMYMGVFNK